MFGKYRSVLFLESAQFGRPFGIRFEAGLDFLADFGIDVDTVAQGAVLYVFDVLIVEDVDVVLQFDYRRRVGRHDEGYVLFDGHSHQNVIPGMVVRYRIDALRI